MYILITIAILPVFLLLTYIYNCDVYEKEPIDMLQEAFFSGFWRVTIGAIVLEFVLGYVFALFYSEELVSVLEAVISAPLCEEGCKFWVLYSLIWHDKNFNEHFDGIVYAVYVSLGFACAENLLYVFTSGFFGGILVGISRGLFAVPGHFLFAVVMGYFFALAKYNKEEREVYLTLSLLCAMLCHACYNGSLTLASFLFPVVDDIVDWGLCTLVSIVLWIIGVRHIRALSAMSRWDHVSEIKAKVVKSDTKEEDRVA